MDYKKYFCFDYKTFCSPIPIEDVLNLHTTHLDDLYIDGNDYDQYNMFFILLNEYYLLKEKGLNKELAHICYLISYYLFTLATPPSSLELATIYIKKAISYDNNSEYNEWLEIVKKGN